ncbi:MAG: hypothetical protein ACR2GA_00100 [Chloroflexota bacterium]
MRRISFAILLVAGLLAALPSKTLAKSAPLKGRYVSSNQMFTGITGGCTCQTQWYTMGVNRGTFRINAVLQGYGSDYTPEYGLRLILLDGKKPIGFQQTACYRSKRNCNSHIHLSVTVPRRSIYYLKVEGPGGQNVRYTINFQANFRHLTCRASCY